MGINVSSAFTGSTQVYNSNMMQQYTGSCDISCNNNISGVNITTIDTPVEGNIELTQLCTVNGTCLIDSNTSALADCMFKASNSTSASNPVISSLLSPGVNVDHSKTRSYQGIQEDITQAVNQNCQVTSTNQMSNINIFAYDSYVGGNIEISQQGQVGGQCQLNAGMSAAAYGTGSLDNCTTSGKKKKGKKCSKGKGSKSPLFSGSTIIGMILLIIVISLFFRSKK